MVVRKHTGQLVSMDIIRATMVNSLKPNVVRQAIVPKLQGKVTKGSGPCTTHVVDIGNSRGIITKDKKGSRRGTREQGLNTKEDSLQLQKIDVQFRLRRAPTTLGEKTLMLKCTPANQAGISLHTMRR